MTMEDKSGARGMTATVVATAALTLAIGVTAASLGGYLVPPNDDAGAKQAQASRAAIETGSVTQPSAPNVVLVPIAPNARPEAPATTPTDNAPEVVLAAYQRRGRSDQDVDDHHRIREHREHEHEASHDDD